MRRRQFLLQAGALTGTAAFGQMGLLASRAAQGAAATSGAGYQALICVFLYGGNDTNNVIVPVDAAGYANYAKLRSVLALPQSKLLPLAPAGGAAAYGLHPALPGLQSLWTSGELAVVANVGTLVQPLTQAGYLATTTQKACSRTSINSINGRLPSQRPPRRIPAGAAVCPISSRVSMSTRPCRR
jgi:uncharacterized protein (DUF1501 family)